LGSKLLKECTLPLTGKGVVDRVITNLGVLDVVKGGLKIIETADGCHRRRTARRNRGKDCRLKPADDDRASFAEPFPLDVQGLCQLRPKLWPIKSGKR